MIRKAFSMIEFVFVIVVVGILAAVMLPRFERETLLEAATQLASHIRYTQHLAMVDDRYDPNDQFWYKTRWQLVFGRSSSGSKNSNGQFAYTIFSDNMGTRTGQPDFTDIDTTEIARDPLNNNKVLSGGYSGTIDTDNEHANKKMNLGETYGITNVTMGGGCTYARLSFDHLGRPMKGDSSTLTSAYQSNRLVTSACNINLTNEQGTISIIVLPETGYTYIDY